MSIHNMNNAEIDFFSINRLSPGDVDVDYFTLLSSFCVISNNKLYLAIEDYLVYGVCLSEVLARDGVVKDDFLIKINGLQRVNSIIEMMIYIKNK